MPSAQAGVASAIASTSRQVGMTLGVAVVGAVAGGAHGIPGAIGKGFAAATHPGWWIIACLGLVVAVLGVLTTTPWAAATARRTARLFGEPAAAQSVV
jgi:hypothetical protein